MAFKKMKDLRLEILKTEIKKDKNLVIDGRRIDYSSIDEMKRAVAPALARAGVDLSFNIRELDEKGPGRIRMKVDFTLSDVDDDDAYETTTVVADGSGQKPIQFALSYALREFFSVKFLLVDGLTSDFLESADNDLAVASVPETPAPAPAPVQAPVTAPAESKPMGHSAPLSRVEAIARDNSVRWFNEAHENGKISEEEWKEISKLIDNCTSGSALQELLCARRKIEAQILDRKV